MVAYPKEVLLKILTAIEFDGDKETFVAKFFENIQLQTMIDLIQALNLEDQNKVKNDLSLATKNLTEIQEMIKAYYSDEQIVNALENAMMKHMTEWVELIKVDLSADQLEKLCQVFQELEQTSLSSSQNSK